MGIFSNRQLEKQKEMAEKLYKENPKLAILVALGEEEPPDDILAVVIYSTVCYKLEKLIFELIKDSPDYLAVLKTITRMGNVSSNMGLSSEARRLKLRDSSPEQTIEIIKDIVNS